MPVHQSKLLETATMVQARCLCHCPTNSLIVMTAFHVSNWHCSCHDAASTFKTYIKFMQTIFTALCSKVADLISEDALLFTRNVHN